MRLRQDLRKAGRGLISAAKAIGTGMPLRDFCTDKKPVDETDLIGIYLVALTGIESPSGPLIPGGLRLVASDGAPDGAPSFATLQDRPLRSTSSDLPGLLRTLEVLVPLYASCLRDRRTGQPSRGDATFLQQESK